MTKLFVIFILIVFSPLTYSQTCIHTDLSKQFNIETSLKRIKDDSCVVTVTILDKVTQRRIQEIRYSAVYLFDKVFKNCESVRSFTTQKNDSAEVMDNDFGDLIIADLNFDGKDDFATIKDSGGNSGPVYYYYIQTTNFEFTRDIFLSEIMEFFPIKINTIDRTLITHVPIGVCTLSEMVYSHNARTDTWIRKSHKEIDICKK
jgi:hypothetical protein